MNYLRILYSCILFVSLLSSCELLEYHPYQDVKGVPSDLTFKNSVQIEQSGRGKDTIRFACITDTQRQYDLTREAVNFLNEYQPLDFVLHAGDLTDFGLADEFVWMVNELNRLRHPWLTVIGNHDFLGTGEHNYARIFGPLNYSLNIGQLHLVCLNTNSREQEYQLPVPDFSFLQNDIQQVTDINTAHPDSLTTTVILMHARPGDEQFNNNVAIPFMYYVRQYPGMQDGSPVYSEEDLSAWDISQADKTLISGTSKHSFIINGHNHKHDLTRAMDDNCLYFGVPDIKDQEIFLFTITPEGYLYETVLF